MSDLNDKHKKKLIHRYGANTASEKELEALFGLLASEELDAALEADMDHEILSLQEEQSGTLKRKFLWPRRIIAAASVVIALSLGLYFYVAESKQESIIAQLAKNDISSGGNKAFLTFEDGSTINLNDDQAGIIIDKDNIKYNDGSVISHDVISTEAKNSVRLLGNTPNSQLALTTPKGGQYQIILADGTKVWLNSASSLKYPNRFTDKERRVELSGEAYFEVAKNAKAPFTVVSDGQVVEVLGTHFNINSYADELVTKTTLLEGSVRVSAILGSAVKLAPNQQSQFTHSNQAIQVLDLDPSLAIDWKEGYFHFDNLNLEPIMRAVSRWYDVEIVYEGAIPTTKFSGRISRNKDIGQILNLLESTGEVHFKVNSEKGINPERRIIVTK